MPQYVQDLEAIFDGPPKFSPEPFVSSVFPPGWEAVLGHSFQDLYAWGSNAFVWNRNNHIVKAFAKGSWALVRGIFASFDKGVKPQFNPLLHRDQLINDRGFLANFIGQIVVRNLNDHWRGLLERDSDVRKSVEALFESTQAKEHLFGLEHAWFAISATEVRKVDAAYTAAKEIKKLLPRPSASWVLRSNYTGRHVRFLSGFDPWEGKGQ